MPRFLACLKLTATSACCRLIRYVEHTSRQCSSSQTRVRDTCYGVLPSSFLCNAITPASPSELPPTALPFAGALIRMKVELTACEAEPMRFEIGLMAGPSILDTEPGADCIACHMPLADSLPVLPLLAARFLLLVPDFLATPLLDTGSSCTQHGRTLHEVCD